MKIGFVGNNYPERRNIIGRALDVAYINISRSNFYAYLNRINFQWKKVFGGKLFRAEYYRYQSLYPTRVDGIHFFNSVSFSTTPFIVTFETLIPYYWVVKNDFKDLGDVKALMKDQGVEKALIKLASDHCKMIIAMSENTAQNQRQFLTLYPHLKERICAKLRVVHPPQERIGESQQKRKSPDCFELIFVGRAFYRKGGRELITALEEVRQVFNIKLYLISSLDPEAGWFNVQEDQIGSDLEWIAQKSWIEHHRNISNDEVIQWMRKCHLGFLPTWQDTYGYSVLEMQACGCPVISTDIRSLPELNSNERGWLIEVPKNEWSEWDYSRFPSHKEASNWLVQQIKMKTMEALSDIDQLSSKGRSAEEYIAQFHDPLAHGKKLSEIYHSVF